MFSKINRMIFFNRIVLKSWISPCECVSEWVNLLPINSTPLQSTAMHILNEHDAGDGLVAEIEIENN